MKQVILLVGLLGIIMLLDGGWGVWANTPANRNDQGTVIRMIVKANAEMDLKAPKTHIDMGIDYKREVQMADGAVKKLWPLGNAETLNPREGLWMLVNGHESMREPIKLLAAERIATPTEAGVNPVEIDLTGEWEIQEEDKAYQATLDAKGNGPYTWQDGRIQTEKVVDRLWSGTWHQKGNDREGGFEVLLSEDGKTAEGVWWYLRVGTHKNIPSRLEGGTYKIQRLSPKPHAVVEP